MFQDSICLKYILPLSTVCAWELFLSGLQCKRTHGCIEHVLGMRIRLNMLTWSGSTGHFVYHVGLPLLIAEIVQFPRKEGCRKSGLIKRCLQTDVETLIYFKAENT